MIRILNLRWGEDVGGVESLLKDLAKYSDKSSYEMIFCFLKTSDSHKEVIQKEGCKVSVIKAKHGYDLGVRIRLFRYLREINPDIIIDHGMPPLLRPVIKLAGNCHLISYDHGCYETYRLKNKHVANFIIKYEYNYCSNYIITNSLYNKHTIIDNYKVDNDKIEVIYPGIDTDTFKMKSNKDKDILVLGYVGRIQFSDKGVDYLVPLAQELIKNNFTNFEFRIIGDGIDLNAFKEKVDHASLNNVFRFFGKVSNVAEQFAEMDILVVPSKSEAFGLSPLEALSVGCSVVCFDVGGLRESVGDCAQTVLIKPFDISEMAKAIIEKIESNIRSESALLSAHDYVDKNYSAKSFVAKLETCITKHLKS